MFFSLFRFDPGSFELLDFVDALSEAKNTSEKMALMPVQPVLSNAQYILFLSYLNTISIPICIFGILTNLTNIVVFYKMGFSSPTNINLFCLAIADLLTLCYTLIVNFGNHPAFQNADLSFSMYDVTRV